MGKFKIDGDEYDIGEPSEAVQNLLNNIDFVDQQILQKNNELHVAQTAKIGYSRALKREIEKFASKDG